MQALTLPDKHARQFCISLKEHPHAIAARGLKQKLGCRWTHRQPVAEIPSLVACAQAQLLAKQCCARVHAWTPAANTKQPAANTHRTFEASKGLSLTCPCQTAAYHVTVSML